MGCETQGLGARLRLVFRSVQWVQARVRRDVAGLGAACCRARGWSPYQWGRTAVLAVAVLVALADGRDHSAGLVAGPRG